jgi:hypothetical protein
MLGDSPVADSPSRTCHVGYIYINLNRADHNDIIQRAKYFSVNSQFLFYFRYTRYSGAALCKIAIQVIDYKSPSRRLRPAALSTSPPIADSLKRDSPPSGAIGGDNISQSTTLFTYYFRMRALLSLESIIQASSALALFECGRSCPSNHSFRPAAPWYYSSAGVLVPRIAPSGQQRLRIIRVWASVPRIIFIGPTTHLNYSSAGFGPSNRLLRASNASKLFECGLRSLESSSSGQQCLRIIQVRALVPRIVFFGPAAPPNYSSVGFGPSNHFHRANSASELFECGLRSLESSSSGQQRLRIIRVWTLVPRIIFIGPTAPPNYSSAGFGPSNRLLRASSASELFECGLRSLESYSSGQQLLRIIRVRASVPRIVFFGPAAPLNYSTVGFGPSNRLLRASSASALFECGLWSLELFSSGQQRLCVIRVRASVPRIILFGPAAPLRYSTAGFGPLNYSLWANNASTLFEYGFQSLESHLLAISAFILFGYGPLSFESLFCAINAFKLPEIW